MKSVAVVVGMNRSGTSLLCQALSRLGVSFGTNDKLVPPDKANPYGYYEHKDVVREQTLMMHHCYDSRGWNDIGKLEENDNDEEWERRIANLASIVRENVEKYDVFGFKTTYIHRIPEAWSSVFYDAQVRPVYFHAMRAPLLVYESMLKANGTEAKRSPKTQRQFMRLWAWSNAALFHLEPVCEVWFDEWFEDAGAVMRRLSKTLKVEPVSTEGLVMRR